MYTQKTIYLILLLLIFSGCGKHYDNLPIEYISANADYAFDTNDPNGTEAELYLASIYAALPLGYNRVGGPISGNVFALNDSNYGPLDATTDDAVSSITGNAVDNLSTSGYTVSFNPDDVWGNMYAGIRKANIFLANYNKVPWAVANKRQWYGAEVRFLRAFFYFELVKRYGGVILIGDKVLGVSDNLDLPRNAYIECITYMLTELDAIKDQLRPDPATGADIGHITQGAAYALKAKIKLYDASPLNNSTNDLAKWQAAADAAQDVITLNKFSLDANVINVFTTLTSRENIFFRMNGVTSTTQTNALEYALSPIGYTVANTVAQGKVSPSQELVDAFPMANGKAITDPTSGYNPANPYNSRDPRLSTTVFFNGQNWLGRTVQTYAGGLDNPNSGAIKTRTGYYERKFLGNYPTGTSFPNVYRPWPYIRYAEVLLDHAEALNESTGATAAVYNDLIALRKRAGINANTDNLYGLPAGASQTVMRSLIRNERRVELAFEEQRYWDLRRWKIAETTYAAGVSGMNIVRNSDGSFTYTRMPVATPFFQSRMYLYPIPYSQITVTSGALKQNPGW